MTEQALVKAGDLARMSFEELTNQDPRSLAMALDQIRKQNVATLGDSEVFVRHDDQGMVRAVRGVVKLSSAQGEVYGIPQGHYEGSKWVNDAPKTMITAPGYQKLNQVAGLSIITPQTVTLPDGNKVINPYLVRERDRHGMPHTVGVWVRKLCVGYSPIGNLCVVDSSLFLDLHLYFLQDLLKKINKYDENGEVLLESAVSPEMRKTHLILPYQYGIVIAANLTKKGVRTVLDTHIQRQKFAERVATTIAERNALKKHPAIAATQVLPYDDGFARVQVFGWKHDLTKDDFDQAVRGMESDEATPGVEIISHTATAGDDDDDAIDAEATVDNDRDKDREIQKGTGKKDKAEPPDDDDDGEEEEEPETLFTGRDLSIREKIDLLKKTYGKDKFEAAYDKAAYDNPVDWKQMSTAEKNNLLNDASTILQKGVRE